MRRIENATVGLCAGTLLLLAATVWAGTGNSCPTTITSARSADPDVECLTDNCTEGDCLVTGGLSGETYVEWAWNGTSWVKTGAYFSGSEVQELTCWCWAEVEPDVWEIRSVGSQCCDLVRVNDGAGQKRVATRGDCDLPGCQSGDCIVIQAPGDPDTLNADCD